MQRADRLQLRKLKKELRRQGYVYEIDKQDEIALLEGCRWDQKKADHICNFFPRFLRHGIGKFYGKPFELLPWQREIVSKLCGWQRPDGQGGWKRRFTQAYVEVAKRNGKSVLAAGLCLYFLLAAGELGSQVYNVANSLDQAKNIWRTANFMIEASPLLKKRIHPIKSESRFAWDKTNSFWKVLPSRADVTEGNDIFFLVCDETHCYKKPDLFEALEHGGESRREPICPFAITTAGIYEPTYQSWKLHAYAKDVIDGVVEDTTMLAVIFTIDPDDDWRPTNPNCVDVWKKANPSLGHNIDIESFRRKAQKAVDVPSSTNSFLRYRLNVWTQASERSINLERWQENNGPVDPSKWNEDPDRLIFCGLDLSSVQDTTAFVSICEVDGIWEVHPMVWLPEDSLVHKEAKDKAQYLLWKDQGFLRTTEGDAIDHQTVVEQILEFLEGKTVGKICLDLNAGGQWVGSQLIDAGYRVEQHNQNMQAMSPACKELERRYLHKLFAHGGNPLLLWQAANVRHKTNEDEAIKYVKESQSKRIDAMIALAMAVSGSGVEELRSSLEDHGIEYF